METNITTGTTDPEFDVKTLSLDNIYLITIVAILANR